MVHLKDEVDRSDLKWETNKFKQRKNFVAYHNVPYENRSNNDAAYKVQSEVAVLEKVVSSCLREAYLPHDNSKMHERNGCLTHEENTYPKVTTLVKSDQLDSDKYASTVVKDPIFIQQTKVSHSNQIVNKVPC